MHPLAWSGDWNAKIDAVSFRKPRDTIQALTVIQKLASMTDGPWVAVTDSGGHPIFVSVDTDLTAVAAALAI